jgi:hypothetical protein
LDDQLVILPELFRRLVDYLALGAGDISLAGFLAFLASFDDRLFVISDAHATGLDNITRVDGQTVRLLHPPDDLIFSLSLWMSPAITTAAPTVRFGRRLAIPLAIRPSLPVLLDTE